MMSCASPFPLYRSCAATPYSWLQTNVDYRPTLQILNSKNKTMRIWREGVVDGVIVNPGATESLQPDDKVDIVSGLPLTYVHAMSFPFSVLTHAIVLSLLYSVQWQKICCFETPGKVRTPISIDGCASLGVPCNHFTASIATPLIHSPQVSMSYAHCTLRSRITSFPPTHSRPVI
jgi:hypothetical protein